MFIDSARRHVIEAVAVGICALVWCVSPGLGQIGMPEVVITPVAHVGDPVPGIPGATFEYISTPQIDAAGNMLFMGWLVGPGIDGSNNLTIFYGAPEGELQLIAREGDPAPDMGGEVTIATLLAQVPALSETGWISFTPRLLGPGIIPGFNDKATFVGPLGNIRKVLQGGDSPPGLEPGVVIDVSGPSGFGTFLSDNATLLVAANLAGPGVDATNDRAYWTGTRDDLQLAWRRGMPAPGTEPGVTFAWADFLGFNDAGEITIRGGLAGATIDGTNDKGRWVGGPGTLALATRKGDPVPGFPGDVVFTKVALNLWPLNNGGEIAETVEVAGPGISAENDGLLFGGFPGELQVVAREGDAAPELAPETEIDSLSSAYVNDRRDILYRVKLRGPSIDDSNAWGVYFGPCDSPRLSLRDGEPAPHFADGTMLSRVAIAPQLVAMNDVGDVLTTIEISGPDVPDEKKVVLWLRPRVLGAWVPLLRSGAVLGGRTVFAQGASDIGDGYNNKTGGSDGQPQSFNDAGQLALQLQFTDGTHGVYRIEPPLFGDADGDGDVDLMDWVALQTCLTGAESEAPLAGCELLDFDWDGDVDLRDCAVFQRLFGSGG